MKKKLFSLFFFLFINLIFIKNEVIPHDDITDTITNNNIKISVNETNHNNTNPEQLNSSNISSTDSKENNIENKTEFIEKETDKNLNQTIISNATETAESLDNKNNTDSINNDANINSNSTESNYKNVFNETSSNNNSNSTEASAEASSSNPEENKSSSGDLNEKANQRNLEEKQTQNENNQKESTQQRIENTEEPNGNNEFNLTEEIEKLYYKRQNDTSTHHEDSYIDDHNSDYYENIEEVKAKEEEENQLRQEKEEAERLRDEWQQKVSDFTAQDLLTIKLKKYSTYKFYEDVQKVPSQLRVAFFVNDELKKINFEILEPSGNPIFVDRNKAQSYFEFEAKRPGVYKFILSNHESVSSLKISFALHAGENVDSNLKSSHLDDFTKHLKHVDRKLKELKFTNSILNKKYDGHHESKFILLK